MNADKLRAPPAPRKDQFDTPMKLTERFCVAFQTHKGAPKLAAEVSG